MLANMTPTVMTAMTTRSMSISGSVMLASVDRQPLDQAFDLFGVVGGHGRFLRRGRDRWRPESGVLGRRNRAVDHALNVVQAGDDFGAVAHVVVAFGLCRLQSAFE